ncbi:hypothetical protein N566_22355 [Streptomycetaceae bacterium MP113-05]|nr:hypothetical protein N566_22355 [Streptomycetaceae bacterium MP113-05]
MTLKPSGTSGSALRWTKSSYSTNDGPDCVEVASTPGIVHVRDSKSVLGPQLSLTATAWADFVGFAAYRR